MITINTYDDIATDLDLWREYVDPDLSISDDQFNAMTTEERIAFIVEIYDPEPTAEEINDDIGFNY